MNWKYKTVARANERVAELEQELGFDPSDYTPYIANANHRVTQLETLLAKRPAPAPAAQAAATSQVPGPGKPRLASGPPPSNNLSRQHLFSLAAVFPLVTVEQDFTDQQLRAAVAKAAYQAHHDIAGLTDDATLTAKLWRADKSPGIGNYMRALRQEKIESILAK